MIVTAPGKIVAWGEYAVLTGAPAGVLAVDRQAEVSLNPRPLDWLFSSKGLLAPALRTADAALPICEVGRIATAILRFWGMEELPAPFELTSDSSAFFDTQGHKLGLGSSAAVCTATYCALADMLERPYQLPEAMDIHRTLQNGRGSGLDVAASWLGGLVHFQQGQASSEPWPDGLHWTAIFTGSSADTGRSIGSFNQWLQDNDESPVRFLGLASERLWSDAADLRLWSQYIEALAALDQAAGLNIYTRAHQQLSELASSADLVYKPCGAGGGDIGLAVSHDPGALQHFVTQAQAHKFVPLTMEIATDGVRLRP